MVNDLEIPFALTRFQIDTNKAFTVEVVSGPVASIKIRRWRFDGEIDEPEFFIDGDLSPDAGVAIGGPGIILPCVVAEFSRLGNRVEGPQHLTGTDIERAYLAFAVVVALDGHSFFHRHADDDDIFDHCWSRVQPGIACFQIYLLSRAMDDTHFEVNESIFAETGDPLTGLRIQFD